MKRGEVEQICFNRPNLEDVPISVKAISCQSSSVDDEAVLNEKTKIERFESQGWDSLKGSPFYDVLKEYEDVFPEEVPAELPKDKGTRHEIDLIPGTKYCVTRQWPLPKEQVDVIDEFFAKRLASGQVRESKSPHCSPTFCVKKATGGWRIVHAYNKLNSATVPAQTPIPRKDMILDRMQGSTIFSTIDLRDGYYQILMRESDIPLTAVSTPSGMLWEWLVMPQGLSNAPATFNRCVSHLFRSCRDFAPTYFDDIFIHSRCNSTTSDVDVHKEHLKAVLDIMRKYKLYANIKKCIFGAPEIPVLGCYVGTKGVRADPEKIKAIVEWPAPKNVKELRSWLGLANYLHKYTQNYAKLVQPLSTLLRKTETWNWTPERDNAFRLIKQSLVEAPILALPNLEKPFHVVCDASDFAIGCALLQFDDEEKERVISYQSRQLKPAERNYPVHDKELLAMKFALVKFRVYLLGSKPFIVYTDHASLRTAIKSPHLSQRMARWLSFFAEYNFTVEYKPGKLNFIGDSLSRRPDWDFKTSQSPEINALTLIKSTLTDAIQLAYSSDPALQNLYEYLQNVNDQTLKLLDAKTRSRLHRYSFVNDLIWYSLDDEDRPRVVVPNDSDLKHRILYEYHDAPASGHLGREKTFLAVARDFYWPHMYKWVRKYVRACDTCQRVKPTYTSKAPLMSLPIERDCWRSISMDFIFGYPKDSRGRTGIFVIVDRFSKMAHLVPVSEKISSKETARVFLDTIFRHHGMPESIVSDRDPRFVASFWKHLMELSGSKLCMSTSAHPETDGQTERVNRVIGDVMRSYATRFYKNWSDLLPMAEFALNNAVHSSHGYTPFYVNYLRHPRVPVLLGGDVLALSVGGSHQHEFDESLSNDKGESHEIDESLSNDRRESSLNAKTKASLDAFLNERRLVIQTVQDCLARAVDTQKEQADKHGRKQCAKYNKGDLVLLSTKNLKSTMVSNYDSNKLLPRFIGPFRITEVVNEKAYRLDIPSSMKLHDVFYVGLLKPYVGLDDPQDSQESQFDSEAPSLADAPPASQDTEGVHQRSEVASPKAPTSLSTSIESRNNHEKAELVYENVPVSDDHNSPAKHALPHSRNPPSPLPLSSWRGPAPLVDSDGSPRYIVDRIIGHKKGRHDVNYHVKWLGYQEKTWEPHSQMIQDVPDVVAAYWDAHSN